MRLFSRLKTLFRRKELKLGLALGSGGAKGMAHLGVLKALEEAGITFSVVAGTSIGSIVGALYAKGYTWADMVQIVENVNRKEFSRGMNPFSDNAFVENFLSKFLDEDFSSLNLPFAAWATDGNTGEGVLLNSGNLSRALAASSAMPPYFRAVEIDGKRLFDGAFTNVVPCDVCKEMGADFVLGVDLSAYMTPHEEKGKLTRIFDSAIARLTPVKYKPDFKSRGLESADFMLSPKLTGFRATDISRAMTNRMFELGYEEAKENMAALKSAIESARRRLKKCKRKERK